MHVPLVASEPLVQHLEACLFAVEKRSSFMSVLGTGLQLEKKDLKSAVGFTSWGEARLLWFAACRTS